jgi:hypothetical protein
LAHSLVRIVVAHGRAVLVAHVVTELLVCISISGHLFVLTIKR